MLDRAHSGAPSDAVLLGPRRFKGRETVLFGVVEGDLGWGTPALPIGLEDDDELPPTPEKLAKLMRGLDLWPMLRFGENVENDREEEYDDDRNCGGAAECDRERVHLAFGRLGDGEELVSERRLYAFVRHGVRGER